MQAGSAAQILLAWEDPEKIRRGLVNAKFNAAALSAVRRRGWAQSVGEREPELHQSQPQCADQMEKLLPQSRLVVQLKDFLANLEECMRQQLLQLQHAHEVPALRTQGTLTALQAAVDANLVSSADARALADSWRAATEIRHAVVMARGVPADAIPVQPADRARVAHLLGYGASGSEQMVEDYLRKSRRARAVVERLFYG